MKHLISQLAHVELLTPKPDETLLFFKELMGLTETGRQGQSVYLRGWGEFFHHSLKITEGKHAGVGHSGWRADSAEALQEVVQAIEATGLGQGWSEGDLGHGPAYHFTDPDGHNTEVFWEVERLLPPVEQRTKLLNRPQKYTGHGAAARRIDHVNLFALDVSANRDFFMNVLGLKYNEAFRTDDDIELMSWLSSTNISHDLALGFSPTGQKGQLNHLALWQDTREEVMRTADILRDADIHIEGGPGRHGVSEAFFLYAREPGGNLIEIFSGGYLNFEPDRPPIVWHGSEFMDAMIWWGRDMFAGMAQMMASSPPSPRS